jgi:hypothetical protein
MNKPEWFDLAEKDGGKTHFEVKRGLRSFVIAIPLLAIGAGVVFAQTSDESPAIAEEATVAIASAAPSLTSAVAQPRAAIGTPPLPPTGGDDDDDDFEDEEDEDDEDEDDD